MIDNFIKLIKIEDNIIKYVRDVDDNYTLEKIKQYHQDNPNVRFILNFKDYLSQEHFTDISKILTDKVIPDHITNIEEMIESYLNDIITFSYETNFIRSVNQYGKLISSDWYSDFVFRAYNSSVGNTSDVISSPNFPDLQIECNRDLKNKIILSNNILCNTVWKNETANALKTKDPYFKNERMCFLDFSYSDKIAMINFSTSPDAFFSIPEAYRVGYDFFLCIKGHPIFLRKGIYYRAGNSIVINWNYINSLPMFKRYTELELQSDINSYICFIECKKIYYKLNSVLTETDTMHRVYFPAPNDVVKINYMCYDIYNYQLFNMTLVEEKFDNPMTSIEKNNNVYIEYKLNKDIPRNFKLLQILITK